ncbi:hypothetical protein QBZ16_003360 [Prototheca wickerhamii]|uniref:Uncharacterized protein n=1 Tax=Prototheca wickerhamii TaxID=3111 RepID=A0AAD9IJT6_PROWI|nr:hypothetical protein QBZ16_003360 [Prototheca wickerhamii]
MMTKAVSAFPISPLGVVDLHYHPTDRFLALTTPDAAHLLDRDLNQIGRLPLDPGNVTATALDSQGAGLVAGSARGTVQLWDLRLRRSRGTWEEARGSSLAVRAVAGGPAQPAVWYVASRAGTIWTLDDRVPTTSTSVVRLGAPVTAFSLKENGAAFAAGTRDGAVYLYDPRRADAPLMTLASGDYEPISSLHWQRCYIQAPARAPAAEPSAERAERATAQSEGGSESGAGHPPRAASALQLDRPLDLSVTPMLRPNAASAASQRRAAELAPFSFSSSSERLSASAAALEDIRRRLPLVGGSAAAEQGRRAAAELSTEQLRRAPAEPIDSVGPRVEAEEPRAPRSPSLALKTQSLNPNAISRDDLLALHLDMLNQFEAQRDHMTSVVEDLVQRNEGLAAELAGLRGLFQELLAQRRGADWL